VLLNISVNVEARSIKWGPGPPFCTATTGKHGTEDNIIANAFSTFQVPIAGRLTCKRNGRERRVSGEWPKKER